MIICRGYLLFIYYQCTEKYNIWLYTNQLLIYISFLKDRNHNKMQLIQQDIKIRQIAEQYLKIQQNTEYLTNIFRYSKFKKKAFIKFQNQFVDIRSFFKLIVQTSYLLYTCYVKKFNIYLSNDLYCFVRRDQLSDIYIEYIIQMDFDNIQNEVEQKMTEKYFNKYLLDKKTHGQAYGEYIVKFIRFYLDKIHKYIHFIKGLKKPISGEGQLMRQIQNLQNVLKHLQINQKKILNPKAIILCLQQTQVFMQHSILLKVMNNSIYSAIRLSKSNMNIFKYLAEIQEKLLVRDNQVSMGRQQGNLLMPKDIQIAIQQCFKFLIKQNIVSSQQSLNDSKSNSKNFVLGEIEGTQEERKFTCRIKIFQKVFQQFTAKKLQQICQNNKVDLGQLKIEGNNQSAQQDSNQIKKKIEKSDYLIEYITSKNLLCIKYITDIELNIENTDLIMFQCNNISFNWNSVSMQLVERNQSKTAKRKQRYVAFKTLAQFSARQKPLLKILLLIDLVMICAKISEPELKKTVIKLQDYWKIQQIGNKINHIINLFIKKVDRIYKTIGSQKSNPNN